MKKLSSLLNEKVANVQWLQDSISHVLKQEFPLTNSIAKELGLNQTIEAVHFTSPKEAMRLINLQGTKKSISAMTKMPKSNARRIAGVWLNGVIYKIQGTLLLGAKVDIMSKPDQRGRRWIALYELTRNNSSPNMDLPAKYYMFLSSNKKYIKLSANFSKLTKNFEGYELEYKIKSDDRIILAAKQLISMHFDLSLQFVKQHKKLFEGNLYFPDNKIQIIDKIYWDEVIVNNVKLLAVVYDENVIQAMSNGNVLEKKIIASVPPGKAISANSSDPDETLEKIKKAFEI